MKKPTLLSVMVFFALLSFSCSKDSLDDTANNANSNIVVPETKVIEIEILELINNHRLNEGLNTLNYMNLIKSQAYNHTDYMIDHNIVSHDNFGLRRNYLMDHAGAITVSENLAYGFTSAESVVNAWLNSSGHRENIEGDFTDFDISAEQNSEGKWYYTNIFVNK